ncbi:MAG TPA: hypothetical protein ENK33_00655 [Desulfobacterales bacterium]|nr:hypothetical protein [Desulfobacterales bacterium]
MRMHVRGELRWAIILFVVYLFSPLGNAAAQENNSSSACIKCHTDFKAMDRYGAKAAAGAAAIAG